MIGDILASMQMCICIYIYIHTYLGKEKNFELEMDNDLSCLHFCDYRHMNSIH